MTTSRNCRSHNCKTTRVFNSKFHERLDCYFAPRCFEGKIYVKNFVLLTTSYNTYVTQQYTCVVLTYIDLLQVLTVFVWYTVILTVLKYSSLRILNNLLGMAMSRIAGKGTRLKTAWKMKKSGFTGCQPGDSFQKETKSPGS